MQQESSDGAERNRFLVNYVDYAFDDFGGRQPPVYPGLSTVWGSLARSKVNSKTIFDYCVGFASICIAFESYSLSNFLNIGNSDSWMLIL